MKQISNACTDEITPARTAYFAVFGLAAGFQHWHTAAQELVTPQQAASHLVSVAAMCPCSDQFCAGRAANTTPRKGEYARRLVAVTTSRHPCARASNACAGNFTRNKENSMSENTKPWSRPVMSLVNRCAHVYAMRRERWMRDEIITRLSRQQHGRTVDEATVERVVAEIEAQL